MLEDNGIAHRYREYTRKPLSQAEIRRLLSRLGMAPSELLRRNDKVCRELGLTGDEPPRRLVALMAEHPTLIQRPIGILGERAVVGRPPQRLLELVTP